MNATEKFYLPFDGILEVFSSLIGHHHHQSPFTHPAPQSTAVSPVLHRPRVSDISKTGMRIIKSATGRWGQDTRVAGTRSSSCGHRLQDGSMDLLELGLTEPGNCRRVVVLGAPGVGKTNILQRFLGNGFEENYEPTAEDFHRKLFHIGGQAYQLDLLDASSERDFPAKRRLSILTGDVFLLVFSLDDKDSFGKVCELLDEIKAAKAKLLKLKNPVKVPVVVCGNKADLEARRVVSRAEAREALGDEVRFLETSARDGSGLEALFRCLVLLGGLPEEAVPSRHQIVPLHTYQSLCVDQRGRRRSRAVRGLGAPCAAVDPAARRPSFTSDLHLVLGSSAKRNNPEKCRIQ